MASRRPTQRHALGPGQTSPCLPAVGRLSSAATAATIAATTAAGGPSVPAPAGRAPAVSRPSVLVSPPTAPLIPYSGMLPCFFAGRRSRLLSSVANPRTSHRRVSAGSTTASR
jgi:hypothetical protein